MPAGTRPGCWPPSSAPATRTAQVDTLLSQMNADVSDPSMKNQQFGPSQVGIAGACRAPPRAAASPEERLLLRR
jgi:hypothetical protein